MVAIPILTNSIPDQEVVINTDTTSLNLFDHFDDPFTTGLVARFELFNPENTFPNEGVTEVVLFDQADEGAPLTIENFTNYVEDGDYINSFIHRSVADFVIQGGGFTVETLGEETSFNLVPTDDPVQNEFSANRSNREGTIAMAKQGNDPNSATSQWFFNLGDNSENLDNQNGGFTAFGEVLSDQQMDVPRAIANLPIDDLTPTFNQAFDRPEGNTNSPWQTTPLIAEDSNNLPALPTPEDFVRYERITISQQEELEFTVTNNSNPQLVEATIEEGELILNYLPDQTGETDLMIKATNLVGETVEDTFSVEVKETLSPKPQPELLFGASAENDTIEITDTETQSIIFTGSGEDTINNSDSLTDGNRFYGGTENDQLILGKNDRAFGKEGNDTLDASFGIGNNRLYGGAGDDILLMGSNDRGFGGEGNDRLFFTTGGGNTVYGGTGNDEFIITPGGDPNQINIVADYTDGEDVVRLFGFPEDLDSSKIRITPTPDGEDTIIGVEDALILLEGVSADIFSA